ncbi:hypothetical protein [Salimicrobium halophilum]|uniref:Uncharacterized protein n=1 Tax=Salimicrobium halophilum TaxID=86666 RepID=A0A1G8R1U5_9BACI|nr:hypothetical protein [Salimicrobium halophilum]SDJ10942.1 hypothetical protein SAMN04490247_0769 [Salimicrobium halophilum]
MRIPFLILLVLLIPVSASATSWAYAFVVWDGYEYKMTDDYITEVGERIGEVTTHSEMEQYGGNFSNAYEKGTAYFRVPGVSTDEIMAVKDGDRYRVAERVGEYTYGSSFTDTDSGVAKGIVIAFLFFGVFLTIMTILAFYYMKRG